MEKLTAENQRHQVKSKGGKDTFESIVFHPRQNESKINFVKKHSTLSNNFRLHFKQHSTLLNNFQLHFSTTNCNKYNIQLQLITFIFNA